MNKQLEDLLNKYIADFKSKQCDVVVQQSIPIVWFGDIEAYFKSQVKIVTVGLNPSYNEFPEVYSSQASPRFKDKTLKADNLYTSLNEYFCFNPYKSWFAHFEGCLNRLGASFGGQMNKGIDYKNTAISLDYFSSIATNPTFSKLYEHREEWKIDQRGLFTRLLEYLSPDIVIMSTAKKYFNAVFDTTNKIYESEGKFEVYRLSDKVAIWGRPMRGTPCVFDKNILTDWLNSTDCTPKEGVFWVMSLDKDKIENGKFHLLYDFSGQESHITVWERLQNTHPELLGFDYEFFPRGRIWKNKEGSEKAYTIFIPSILNCKSVVDKVNETYCLNSDYIIETDN